MKCAPRIRLDQISAGLLLAIIMLQTGCINRKKSNSSLDDAAIPRPAITRYDTESGLKASLYEKPTEPYDSIALNFERAGKDLEIARQIMAKDADSRYAAVPGPYQDTSASNDQGVDQSKRVFSGNIPEAAADAMAAAAKRYTTVTGLFDVDNPSINYDDLVANKKCAGTMFKDEYTICGEILRATKLYQLAATYLAQYLTQTSSGEYFQAYLSYYASADAILGKLYALRNEAFAGWLAINQGTTEPIDFASVPYLAVVGDPDKILGKVSQSLQNYKDMIEQVVRDRFDVLQVQGDKLSAQQLTNSIATQKLDIVNQTDLVVTDQNLFKTDFDFNRDQAARIFAQAERNSRKFSLEMRSVMGEVNASSLLREEHFAVRPDTGADHELVVTGFNGLLDMSAGNTPIRANGIYFNNLPAGAMEALGTGWGGSIGKAFSSGAASISRVTSGATSGAIGLIQSNKGPLMGSVIGGLMGGPMGSLGGLGGLRGLGQGGSIDVAEAMKDGLRAVTGVGFAVAEAALPGGLSISKPLDMARKLAEDLDGLKYPQLAVQVYLQSTNVNGYMISRSVGASIGSTTGESTGTNLGLSTGVSGGPVVINASAGASLGVNRGTSNGASIGKNSGLSSQVGFFHPSARYPNVQVGALLAELYCDTNLKGAYVVGLSNFIDINTDGCTKALVRFFINDNIEGAAKVCSSSPKLSDAERLCASSVPVPLTVRLLKSVQESYRILYAIVQTSDIKEAIQDAAYSSDPDGSAWRIFQQRAREKSVPDEFISRFKPVLDQVVAIQKDNRELVRLAMENQKLASRQEQSIRSHSALAAKANLLADTDLAAWDMAKLKEAQLAFVKEKLDIHQAYSNFYLDRLTRWIGFYRASVKYHRNKVVRDPVADLRVTMADRLDQAVKDAAGSTLEKALATLRDYKDGLNLQTFIDTEGDKLWIQKLAQQTEVDHCKVSLQDMVVGGSMAGNPRALFGTADQAGNSEYPVALVQAKSGQGYDVAEFDAQLAADLAFKGTGAGGDGVFNAYYRLHFTTDPSPANIFPYTMTPASQLGSLNINNTPRLQCRLNTTQDLSKLLGIAFTYRMEGQGNLRSTIFVEHEPVMFAYNQGRKIFRTIDWWAANTDFMPNPPKKVSAINLVREADAINHNCQVGAQQSWTQKECYYFLLGGNVLPSDGSRDFKVNFFNAYVGGSWNVYVPYSTDDANVWAQMRKDLKGLDMHMFFARTEAVH